ncbi:MAG TPA: hypothetical protein VGE45_10195 [Chloroflexia bacterium]|jgi:hypothetical protein
MRDKRKGVVGLAFSLIFILGLLWLLTNWDYVFSAVSKPEHGTINITRTQYEEALAKWRSHRVEKYQITLEYLMGRTVGDITLEVSDQGKNLYRLQESNSDGPDPMPGAVALDDYEWATVDGLFNHVEDTLRGGPFQSGDISNDQFAFFYDYVIAFDPDVGYPSEIRRNGRAPNHWSEGATFIKTSGPAHTSYFISIKALNILKSSKR